MRVSIKTMARQLNSTEDLPALYEFTNGALVRNDGGEIVIRTVSGDSLVSMNDYIVKSADGSIVACTPDEFKTMKSNA